VEGEFSLQSEITRIEAAIVSNDIKYCFVFFLL